MRTTKLLQSAGAYEAGVRRVGSCLRDGEPLTILSPAERRAWVEEYRLHRRNDRIDRDLWHVGLLTLAACAATLGASLLWQVLLPA